MNSLPSIKERQVVDLRFVGRFAFQLLLVIAAGGGILFLGLYLIFVRPLPSTYSGIYFALRNLSAYLLPILIYSMLAYVLAVSLGVGLLSAYVFHKIAGPLYRMDRSLENFDSGHSVKAVFFRKGDGLVALAQGFNRFVACLREDRQKCLGAMEHAERLCLQDRATCRAEMGEALARLSEMLSRYR